MKRWLCLFVLCLTVLTCNDDVSREKKDKLSVSEPEKTIIQEYKLDVYDFDGFESFLNQKNEKTYVVNFWATWCAPCIKELPYFEEVNEKYKNRNVEVILVSLDFPKQYEKKLIPFIRDRKLQSKVIALDDPKKMNDWIPKISEDWSGAIPATLIYNKDRSQFYERSFNLEELETELKQFINL